LHNEIQLQLLNTDYANFQKLVDKAIIIESKQAEMERDGKRKLQHMGQQPNANTRPRLMKPQSPFYSSPTLSGLPCHRSATSSRCRGLTINFSCRGRIFTPTSKQPGVSPQPSGTPSSYTSSSWHPAAPSALPRGPCFNCGQHRHFANRCPVKKTNPVTGANQQPLQQRNANQVQ
jgi:hypothetical protein